MDFRKAAGKALSLAVVAIALAALTAVCAPLLAPAIVHAASGGKVALDFPLARMLGSENAPEWFVAYDKGLVEGGFWYVFPATFAVLCAALAIAAYYQRLRNPKRDVRGGVLGDERIFRTRQERVRRNVYWDGIGSAPGASLVYGFEAGCMVGDPAFTHAFVDAKSGSGKSRFLGYPTLFWNASVGASVVYTARKLTEYLLTSQAMENAGYRVFLLDLQQPKRGHRFNLLDAVNACADSGDIAGAQRASRQIAADFIRHDEKNPYFSNAARALLSAAVLAVALSEEAAPEERNMASVARVIRVGMTGTGKDPGAPLKDFIRGFGTEHPVYKAAEEFLQDKGSTAAQNVASTLMTGITILGDEGIEWMLSGSDFTLRQLMEEKCVLYPHVMGDDDPYNAVLTAVYNQLWNAAQEVSEENGGKLPRPFVVLGDEWGNIPRVSCLGEMVSLGRSMDFHVFLFVQNMSQLNKYNDAGDGGAGVDKLLGSMNLQVAMSVMKTKPDGEYFSDLCGKRTVLTRSDTQNRRAGSVMAAGESQSLSEHQVELVPAYSFKNRVPSRDGIVVVKGGSNDAPGNEGVFEMPVADVTKVLPASRFFGMGSKEEDRRRCEEVLEALSRRARCVDQTIPSWCPDFAESESETTRAEDIEDDELKAWDEVLL